MSATAPGLDASLFQHFRAARDRRRPAWAVPLLAGCMTVTAGIVFAMWAKAIWQTERLQPPSHSIDLAIAPSPPPPPPPPPGGEKPRAVVITPRTITVRSIVQPVKLDQPPPAPATSEQVGSPEGKEGGVPGGKADGDPFGVIDSPTPPTPPPQVAVPKLPKLVPPNALEASRIAGDKQIAPDDVTKLAIERSGKNQLVGTFKVCLTEGGAIGDVTALEPTGFPAYDQRIVSTIRGTWRYRPFEIDGHPAPVCTAVTFIYSQ